MTNVIEFKTKAAYPNGDIDVPTFSIAIYDYKDGSGFSWVVTGESEDGIPPSKEQLQDYLGDMFLSLAGDDEPEPGIFRRATAFFSNLFTPWRLQ